MCNCMGNSNQNGDNTTDETQLNVNNLIEGNTIGTTGCYSRNYSKNRKKQY